ncbi:phosphatidylserine/phosphatidylglycerophosphate/cardiolipin synthase family protein [Marinobacteraceae bacterium S3BR75-40.1]
MDDCRTAPETPDSDRARGFDLFTEGDALYDAMLADIRAATQRVWLETYIWVEDPVGKLFIDALSQKAREGLDVRVRVDAVGSKFGLRPHGIRKLKASGAVLSWCHPWQWLRPWLYHRRNHRKLLVVDDRAAYLGGYNIAAVNSQRHVGRKRWRDTQVRLTGAPVRLCVEAFRVFGRGRLSWRGGNSGAYLLTNHGKRCRFQLRCLFLNRMASAGERIWLTTPYFVPDSRTVTVLSQAARRGADVRVLLPRCSDVPLAQWAAKACYSRLLNAGVRLHEYQPRVLHAKTLVIDREWASIGTANLDYRSLFINYELNFAAKWPALNAALAWEFERDLLDARSIGLTPWKHRGAFSRMEEWIGWGLRHWL